MTTLLPEPELTDSMATNSIVLNLIIAVLLAPIIETTIFQALIIEIVFKFIKRPRLNIWIAILASSTAFALNHTYSFWYIFITFIAGVILALAYYLGKYRKEGAFILVFIIHSMYNLLTSLYNFCLYGFPSH